MKKTNTVSVRVPSLLEAYGSKEAATDEAPLPKIGTPFAYNQKPREPKKQAPNPTALPPTKNQQLWQMTQDFLKSKTGGAPGEKPGGQKGATAPRSPSKPGVPSSTASKFEPLSPDVKPKYSGKFVGQTANLGGRYVSRPTSFTADNPETGEPEQRFGKVQSKQDDRVVWNGKDWVSGGEFDSQFPGKK